MNKISLILGASILLVSGQVGASLFDRGNGLIYDDFFNITWIQNANYATDLGLGVNGRLTWSEANGFVSRLDYAGFTDWRLPFTPQFDGSCSGNGYVSGATPSRYNYGAGCGNSELGHLYNVDGIMNTNPELFTNIVSGSYWSTTFESRPLNAWYHPLLRTNGNQNWISKNNGNFVLAVHDGDIGVSPVPIPATLWLFGTGIIGLVGFSKRRKATF